MWRAVVVRRWGRVRRARLLTGVAATSLLVFGGLALLLRGATGSTVDLAITTALQRADSPLLERVMWAISAPGWGPLTTLGVPAAALAFLLAGYRREALFVLLTAGASTLSGLSKLLIARPRPEAEAVRVASPLLDYSYPSGHVVAYVSIFGFLFFLIYVLFGRSVWRTLALCTLGFLVATIGLSRIYLGQHWASDVLGGYALGSAYLLGLILLYQLTSPLADEPAAVPTERRRDQPLPGARG